MSRHWSKSYVKNRGWRASLRRPDGTGWTSKWLPQEIGRVQELDAESWISAYYAEWIKSYGKVNLKNHNIIPSAKTIRSLNDRWLALRYERRAVSLNYYKGLYQSMNNWILDSEAFPHYSIEDLDCESEFTVDIIRQWIASICPGGKSSSKLAHIGALKAFFTDCIQNNWIDEDMTNPLDRPAIKQIVKDLNEEGVEENVIVFMKPEDATALLTTEHNFIPDYRRLRYLLAMATGLREAEIQALSFDDINWSEKSLIVTKQLVKAGTSPVLNYNVLMKTTDKLSVYNVPNAVVKEPKYNSKREIPLHPLLLEALKVWKAKLWRHYTARLPSGSDPVFPRENRSLKGGQVAGAYTTSESPQLFQKDLRRLDLPSEGFVFHSMRHSFATYLESVGAEEAKISALLGHKAKSVARKNYIGRDIEAYRALIDALPFTSILLDGALVTVASSPVKMRLVHKL
jgi:integrase